MRKYKLGIAVLTLLIILILIIIGQVGYFIYDQQRVVTYEQVLEREFKNLEEIDRIEIRHMNSEDRRFAREENTEIIHRLLEEPADMGLQKTSGFTSDFLYMIWSTHASLRIEIAENEIGIGTDIFRITNENKLLDFVQEIEEDLEWEE